MDMGNSFYRPTPRRTHNTEEGYYSFYNFGASQITGWRNKQEDRYICLPKFSEDFSLFAVYDGHGGDEVVQYLYRYLHVNILNELVIQKDTELALYLGFLTTDNSIRHITKKEREVIEDDLDIEFELPDKEERREVIFGMKNLISNESAGTSKNDCADDSSAPGTSKRILNPELEDVKAEIASACIKQLPSVFFLTQAPVEKDDESDEEYDPSKDNIKHNYFEVSGTENEDEESGESDETGDDEDEDIHEELPGDEGQSADKDEAMELCDDNEKKCAEKSEDSEKESNENDNSIMEINPEAPYSPSSPVVCADGDDSNDSNEPDEFAATCGSTATVVLFNEKKVYIANVGDSRCVACINGQAVDLSVDHKPSRKEERARIISGGGTVSSHDRVNNYLDMSRAFGDFKLKQKNVAEPFQVLSCEPYIRTIDVTPSLEFIIIASDGIWNTMESSEVIDYLKDRMQDTGMELRDICGEMFEQMLPSEVTDDGSGCDNMTAILIQFKNSSEVTSTTPTVVQECYKYIYPPQHRKQFCMPENNTSPTKDVSPNQQSEKLEPEVEESAISPISDENFEPYNIEKTFVPMEPASVHYRSPYYDGSDNEVFSRQSKRGPSTPPDSDDHYEPLYSAKSTKVPFSGDNINFGARQPQRQTTFTSVPGDQPQQFNEFPNFGLQGFLTSETVHPIVKEFEEFRCFLHIMKDKLRLLEYDLRVKERELDMKIASMLAYVGRRTTDRPSGNSTMNPDLPSTSGGPNPVHRQDIQHQFWYNYNDILDVIKRSSPQANSMQYAAGPADCRPVPNQTYAQPVQYSLAQQNSEQYYGGAGQNNFVFNQRPAQPGVFNQRPAQPGEHSMTHQVVPTWYNRRAGQNISAPLIDLTSDEELVENEANEDETTDKNFNSEKN